MQAEGAIEALGGGEELQLRARGSWRVEGAARLDKALAALRLPAARRVRIDLGGVEALDTVGAWLILRLERRLAAQGSAVTVENLAAELAPLFEQVKKHPPAAPPEHGRPASA